MLVGAYPFEDPEEPKNFRKTIQVILSCTIISFVFLSYTPYLLILSVGTMAENLECPVLNPGLRSYISRVLSSDLEDIRGGPCKGKLSSFLGFMSVISYNSS